MYTFWEITASNAAMTVILAAAVGLLGRIWRNPSVLHLLWVLVLVKFVTPPLATLSVPWAGPFLSRSIVRASEDPSPGQDSERPGGLSDGRAVTGLHAPNDGVSPANQAAAPRCRAINWRVAFVWVWGVGAVALGSFRVYRIIRFARELRFAQRPSAAVATAAERIGRRLRLRRMPEIRMLNLRVSPLVWSLGGKAVVYLPADLFGRWDESTRETILTHELAHVRRGDHRVRLLELAITTLYWWHPVAWWSRARLRELEETCCDAFVGKMSPHRVGDYARALLDTMQFVCERAVTVPAGATAASSFRSISRRIQMLKERSPVTRLTAGTAAIVLTAAAFPMAVAFAFGASATPVPTATANSATLPDSTAPGELAGTRWQIDFETARAKAARKKKLLLVAYVGDYNRPAWDKKLREEVFDQESFQKAASNRFVLVEIGGPPKTPERMMQLDHFMEEHGIGDFPAAVIMDSAGGVVAKVAYRPGDAESFVKHLGKLAETWDLVLRWQRESDKLQGFDRIKLLGQLIKAYDELGSQPKESAACCREIISLDPANKSGLKANCEFRLAMIEFRGLIQNKDVAEAVTVLRKADQIKGLHDTEKIAIRNLRAEYEPIVEALETYTVLCFKANKAKGLARAKTLDQLIETYRRLDRFASKAQPAPDIDGWSREIVSLDASDRTGLKKKYVFRLDISDAWRCYRENRLDDGQLACDRAMAIPGLMPEQRQEALSVKGDLYSVQKNNAKALEYYQKALDAMPQGPRARQLKEAVSQLTEMK